MCHLNSHTHAYDYTGGWVGATGAVSGSDGSSASGGVIFSPTESPANPTWAKHCPGLFIHSEYDPEVIRGIVKNQQRIAKSGRKPPGVFIVLDDCMYNKNAISNDKYLRYVFQNGRHNGIHLVIAAQYLMDLGPALRGNIDVIFACSENNDTTRKKIWTNFFGYMDYLAFKQLYRASGGPARSGGL
eukprot:tig00000492_g1412.t1